MNTLKKSTREPTIVFVEKSNLQKWIRGWLHTPVAIHATNHWQVTVVIRACYSVIRVHVHPARRQCRPAATVVARPCNAVAGSNTLPAVYRAMIRCPPVLTAARFPVTTGTVHPVASSVFVPVSVVRSPISSVSVHCPSCAARRSATVSWPVVGIAVS